MATSAFHKLTYWDRLYGVCKLSEDALRIYQTPQFARLNRVSLSAVPSWAHSASVCASRAEHCRGVRHLSRLLVEREEFNHLAKDLVIAATIHDIGHPPFSHLSEYFLQEVTGKNHEEFAYDSVVGTELEKVIESQGGNLERILNLIVGEEKPFSSVVNGTIDLDNADHVLRYSLSVGAARSFLYNPEKIARAFVLLKDGRIAISSTAKKEVDKWKDARKKMYEFILSRENLLPVSMLSRALEFAFLRGELTADYFKMTDDEATFYLSTKVNGKTKAIFNSVLNWEFYSHVARFEYKNSSLDGVVGVCSNWRGRKFLADILCDEFGISYEDICVTAKKNKGIRDIDLPFVEEDGTLSNSPLSEQNYVVWVFASPRVPMVLYSQIGKKSEEVLTSGKYTLS